MSHEDPSDIESARELAELPVPPIDPVFSARVQRRARAAFRGDRGVSRGRRPTDAIVPVLLAAAGVFYALTSFELMLRIFVG